MKKKIVLNFWKALLLLIAIRIVAPMLLLVIPLSFSDFYKTDDSFKIYLEYLEYLLYVPFIFWFANKTNTNFKKLLPIPDASTVLEMLIIILLAKLIIVSPLDDIYFFVLSLLNSKLRIIGTSIMSFVPLNDLKVMLFVPIVEELLFRGLILTNFLKKYSPVYAILLSSLLFGAHHLNLENFLYYLAMGIIYGILFYTTNSLIIVVLAHMFYNVCCSLRYEFIDLNMTNSLLHLCIYVIASGLLVFLLKRSIKAVSRNNVVDNT